MEKSAKVMFAGGGTAGHLLPAISVAEALVEKGVEKTNIFFMGTKFGQDSVILESAGFKSYVLNIKGIKREFSIYSLKSGIKLITSLIAATKILNAEKPQIVLAVGGFASIPGGIASVFKGIPLIVINIDAHPGAANRVLSKFSKITTVTEPTPKIKNSSVVGTPLRRGVFSAFDRVRMLGVSAVKEKFGVSGYEKIVLIVGGSLGSKTLNVAAPLLAETLNKYCESLGEPPPAVVHIAGRRGINEVDKSIEINNYFLREYVDEIELLYAVANLIICRAGASTVAEVAALHLPAIFVPLPNAPGDHQRMNVMKLEKVKGALIVSDQEVGSGILDELVPKLLFDSVRLESMSEALEKISDSDGADKIAEMALNLIVSKQKQKKVN